MTPNILLLLEEDDLLIPMSPEEELADAGFGMVVATNGKEAMAALGTEASRFRAVLTHIRLGRGPDGWEVARHARAPSLGANTPSTGISTARPEIDRARARWTHQRARRSIANLDREPGPPHAPEASPVEGPARRFG